MKNIKKYVALVLALCFLAVLPLTAAAGSAGETAAIGTWTVHTSFDSETQTTQDLDSSASTLVFYANGNVDLIAGTDLIRGTWKFLTDYEDGYVYELTLNYNGNQTTAFGSVITNSKYNFKGDFMLMLDSTTFLYHKA